MSRNYRGYQAMRFRKMHGCGNDFVILDQKDIRGGMLTSAQIEDICDRHYGVGCDLLALLQVSQKGDIFARFYNSDGSESHACGNATRCVADLVMSEIGQDSCAVETSAGLLECKRAGELIEVDMGPPFLEWRDIPLAEEVDTLDLPIGAGDLANPVSVGMGNPHCIFFVDSLVDIPVEELGATYEQHLLFPEKTNVEFVEIISEGRMRQKTWERGVGLTLACGSGACAAAVAGTLRGLTGRSVEIELDGGALNIEWRESDDHVLMRGPAVHVFDGELRADTA